MTSLDRTLRTVGERCDAWRWYDAMPRVAHRTRGSRFPTAGDRIEPLAQERDAEGPLCARAADHHRADGGPAVGGRLRVHGAALEPGDAAAVRRRGAGHRRADRRLQRLSAGRRPRADAHASRRTGSAWWSISCPSTRCRRRGRSRSSRCSTRRCRTKSRKQIGRPFWIDTVGQLGAGRNPHPARQRGDARVRAAAAPPMPPIRKSSCSGWSAPRWCCSPSPSCSCAIRSGRSCGWPTPPKVSARAARCRTSVRAARARCAARRRPSSR